MLRKAYEMVIRHQLELLVEEKGCDIPREKWDEIAEAMADDYNFLNALMEFTDEHLEVFGENYGL